VRVVDSITVSIRSVQFTNELFGAICRLIEKNQFVYELGTTAASWIM